MSTLREAAIGAMGALETARNGLAWYRDRYPESTDGSDDEAAGDIDAAIDALRAELVKPDAPTVEDEPAPQMPEALRDSLQRRCVEWGVYWRAPDAHGVDLTHEQALELLRDALGVEVEIAAAPRPAPAEPQPAAQQEPVVTVWQARATHDSKSAWRQVAPTKTESTVEARVEYLKTVRRAGGEPAYEFRALYTSPPQVQRAGLTDEQIDRHSIAAADCPPSSTVILVSSLRRLLGITATKGDNHA